MNTVKASNFGPHESFGPLFQKGLLSSKRVLQRNEENESCRKNFRSTSSVLFNLGTPEHLLLDKSPKVGSLLSRWNLTNSKIAETTLKPLKSWHFCNSNFRTC
jgi:hypothetical protein